MAKIKHNNFLETVNEVFTDATNEGVLHLYANDNDRPGRTIIVNGKRLFHFGTTGYLALEQDPRLKRAAIAAIEQYGTQFPLSKTYISHPLYRELEAAVTQMYGHPIIITKNSTLGHIGVIPSAVDDRDAIVLDHQVHWSVQNAAQILKNRSVPIELVRHNNLDMLEDKIKKYANTRQRIWYMADGIYSMYGDYAPVKELMFLMDRYPQLHLYFDDVHGMSWTGRNGTGYIMSEIEEPTDRMLLFGTLSKTFGASGAVLVCKNKALYKKIKTFGGPLTFSAQLEPASVAAATASAKIHLSPEIYRLQKELNSRTKYFNELLKQTDLPLIDNNNSPVFYIGTGMPKTGYNFVNRLMNEGFFVNLGIFPAVPVKNTGVRITISRHNQFEEIKALVDAMVYHYPKALEDTHTTKERVYHAFRLPYKTVTAYPENSQLAIQLEDSVDSIDKKQWDNHMKGQGTFDWMGLKFLETVFSGNALKEHNWKFKYLCILDSDQEPVLMTFFTVALWKDDMFSKPGVSRMVEASRMNDPYHMTSKVLSMGSLFTEGQHLFINEAHPLKEQALHLMMRTLESMEKTCGAKMLVLRDFSVNGTLNAFFHGQGFVKLNMPESCYIELQEGVDIASHIAKLSTRNRKHYKKEIAAFEPLFEVRILKQCSLEELDQMEALYEKVRKNNLGLNTFSFPSKLFSIMSGHPQWEFITLRFKTAPEKIIGVMFCYNNLDLTYVPAFIGMDYQYVRSHHTYRQLLFQTIKRAMAMGFKRIDLGMTAAFEKRKLGATVTEKVAYLQTADNFILDQLGVMERQQ
ncbi:bifunctional aminotransferase class I/II-fold pyridoxal phosphate-dependent enzyme/GNAT family N-acetyltransferase [Snuella lapsa]|uniref:Aminotransferase class I/II-fold pyridoxal phosphate-dependent enzyme n=1 Tax=Snuella lapsa TaxID=870481 RepID=A0ABP6XVU5_9FLAO